MKLMTLQHKKILDDIKDSGVYFCDVISDYHLRTPNAYAFLKARMALQYTLNFTNVIFAWRQLYKDIPLDIPQAERAFECTGFNTDNYYLFELDMCDEHVLLTNFYNFVDLRCQEEGIDDIFPDDEYSYTYEEKIAILEENTLDISTHDEIQAVIPYIKREDIVGIYSISYESDELRVKNIGGVIA